MNRLDKFREKLDTLGGEDLVIEFEEVFTTELDRQYDAGYSDGLADAGDDKDEELNDE
jgi:hypothetical protein